MSPARSDASSDRDRLFCLPYGAGHGSEGVCLLIYLGPHRVLLDCGLQELSLLKGNDKPPADWVFCTNARRDRARGLLELHETYPQLPIYGSEVTAKLLPLNWLERPLEEIPNFCQGLPWRSLQELSKDLTIELFPAGNLPGAAAILLNYATPQRTYKVLYTGDFFLSNSRLVEGLSVESLRGSSPDILILEGSYGTARHPRRRQQEKQLIDQIDRALAENRSILLPVPPLGLGQEILMLLRSHHQFTGRDVDIWVDGEVAVACDFYLELLPQLPTSVQNFAKHQSLFWDEQILPHLRRLEGEFDRIARIPCIALVDDTLDLRSLQLPETTDWTLLWPEPLGSERRDELEAQLSDLPHLQFETYLLSEHSDGRNTTQLIHNIRPQHVIFVRGSALNLADLTSLEELQTRYQLHSPAAGTLVELPIGDTFLQPAAPPETNYEGELNELDSGVTIMLPNAIASDPHWKTFAETGIVEARWQGEELVLRGLSQRELLGNSQQTRRSIDLDSCQTCRHQRSQRCYNPVSPLYAFKVTPDGYCPAFEAMEGEG